MIMLYRIINGYGVNKPLFETLNGVYDTVLLSPNVTEQDAINNVLKSISYQNLTEISNAADISGKKVLYINDSLEDDTIKRLIEGYSPSALNSLTLLSDDNSLTGLRVDTVGVTKSVYGKLDNLLEQETFDKMVEFESPMFTVEFFLNERKEIAFEKGEIEAYDSVSDESINGFIHFMEHSDCLQDMIDNNDGKFSYRFIPSDRVKSFVDYLYLECHGKDVTSFSEMNGKNVLLFDSMTDGRLLSTVAYNAIMLYNPYSVSVCIL